MNVELKHNYRFVYLRSEEWKGTRLQALAKVKGACLICGEKSYHNDAHHVVYPKNIWHTKPNNLVILCRPCHDLVHNILEIRKRTSKRAGIELVKDVAKSINVWRQEKEKWVNEKPMNPSKIKKIRNSLSNCFFCNIPIRIEPQNIMDLIDRPKKCHIAAVCEKCENETRIHFSNQSLNGIGVASAWKLIKDWRAICGQEIPD